MSSSCCWTKLLSSASRSLNSSSNKQRNPRASRKRERGEARPDVFYVLLGVPSQGLSPQALACARILATAADVNHIPESEAMELIEAGKQSGRLRTSQDSWHIFQYYRPQLIAGDYLRMITNQ